MSDVETRYHEAWIGMVQPVEGLVVSLPVLVEAQSMHRQAPSFQQTFLDVCPLVEAPKPSASKDAPAGPRRIADLPVFLNAVLEWGGDLYDTGDALPDDLSLYVPEGKQTLRPTLALKRQGQLPAEAKDTNSDTPATKAGSKYVALLWEVLDGLNLDKPETATGPWEYPPSAKFDRLLRQCRVPIGLLTNRREVRLFYAPHGESSGVIRFKVDDMASVGGRPILDAFVMLLSAYRFFGALHERQLPAILAESRKRQINVTNQLADQVFEALEILLRGFEAAGERDTHYATLLREAMERGDDHLYGGLLTVLLRLVFALYAEDRGLLPVENAFYSKNFSLLALFDELQQDHGAYPDSMSRRFGAWPRLLALFRAIFLGCEHGELRMPQRRGELFDPHVYPFLEGWGPAGSAPITLAENRAAVDVPSVDDQTVFEVLQKLLLLEGQRLSYRALDVEQIGSVYEALMGYHVRRVEAPSVCLKPDRAKAVWVSAVDALSQKKAQRAKWFKDEVGLAKGNAEKIAKALEETTSDEGGLRILEGFRVKRTQIASLGRLVIQPGSERKRTSSHYTPRSLSAPIVEKTLAPLIKVMGGEPSSERLLNLKICDPAMGSGAFLVEACRYLADHVVAAWTLEQRLDKIADEHDDVVNHARRLVAQRCLYGVDKNRFAVNLAKLSLWLVTLAKDEPFTFVDHALRHGDSLVGLDFEQIKSFHWKPSKQLELCRRALEAALDEAISLRQQILELAASADEAATKEKYRLLRDAEDALEPVRLIGDLVVGAFFAGTGVKDRQKERDRRLALVEAWLAEGGAPPPELLDLQQQIRARLPVFHWMTEFPEVFFAERPDPLDEDQVNRAALMDAFMGNPPFLSGSMIATYFRPEYSDWVYAAFTGCSGKTDLVTYFFRSADRLLGVHGTIGLLATKTIAEGDTRKSGLDWMLAEGSVIYSAQRDMKWPGDASVTVSPVHIAKGIISNVLGGNGYPISLDGCRVEHINSRLEPRSERTEPLRLHANAELSFHGWEVGGLGFVLSVEERQALVERDPRNAEKTFIYVGGDDVNHDPRQQGSRFVINFQDDSYEEASEWPDLMSILRERVYPQRQSNNREAKRTFWWRFAERQPSLALAMSARDQCLVCSIVSKHLLISYQPTNRVFSANLWVFAENNYEFFGTLQSRIHEVYARKLSSRLENRLKYTASRCFETYPFPKNGPSFRDETLFSVAKKVAKLRMEYAIDNCVGLTSIYNSLKCSETTDNRIEELRQLHIEMDRAVLDAYGWSDIEVPSYTTPTTPEEKKALEAFQDEVIDRLFVLNAERAKEEQLAGASAKKGKGKPKGGGKGKKPKNENQLGLLGEEPE